MSPDHSLTNKKGNLLATSTSKIDIKTLRYFHQKQMFFYQMAVWIGLCFLKLWSTRRLGGCCCHDGQHRHQQVSQTGDTSIINTSINYTCFNRTNWFSANLFFNSTMHKIFVQENTHFPLAMNHQPASRNRTWVGSISSPIYHWFLMFRTNDVGKNNSFWNEWNITWRETHASYFLGSFPKHDIGKLPNRS